MKTFAWVICSIWEIVYKNMIRARYLKDSKHGLLRVAYRTYRGKDREVHGQPIKKRDTVAELHLSNLALYRYRHLKSPEWAVYKDLIAELHLLSEQVKANHRPIVALRGITILAPAALRLGFVVEEIPPGVWAALNHLWLRLLRLAYSPKQSSEYKALDAARKPVEIWMSAERFTERF